jgi:serine/threonine protein kinase
MVTNCGESDLLKRIQNRSKPLGLQEIRAITEQLTRSVAYLHSRDVIHRDLKPSNILYGRSGRVQICDFGLARSVIDDRAPVRGRIRPQHLKTISQCMKTKNVKFTPPIVLPQPALTDYCGTPCYRPPEYCVGATNYSKSSDVWAIGCIVAELLQGYSMFDGTKPETVLYAIVNMLTFPKPEDISADFPDREEMLLRLKQMGKPKDNAKSVLEALKNGFPGVSPLAIDFMLKCFQFNPNDRATAQELSLHPFLKNAPRKYTKVFGPALINQHKPIVHPLGGNTLSSVHDYREAIMKLTRDPEFIFKIEKEPPKKVTPITVVKTTPSIAPLSIWATTSQPPASQQLYFGPPPGLSTPNEPEKRGDAAAFLAGMAARSTAEDEHREIPTPNEVHSILF